jgi:hypothetical protein
MLRPLVLRADTVRSQLLLLTLRLGDLSEQPVVRLAISDRIERAQLRLPTED